MKKKIVIIGNNNGGNPVFDGGRIKTRLYSEIAKREGFDVELLDIHKWYFKPLKIIHRIKKAIKEEARIIVMAGPKGCRVFIPLVAKLNKKGRSEMVFCPLGVGAIDKFVKPLNSNEQYEFMNEHKFNNISDKKMAKILQRYDSILVQSKILKECYESFYQLNNVCVLNNFRDIATPTYNKQKSDDVLKVIFLARVTENKGIYDLLEVVKQLNVNNTGKIRLDIYGELQVDDASKFNSLLDSNISYKGCINSADAIKTIGEYDLLCLPTRYHGEGIPGSVVESLISGTPVLVSSYNQISEIITDGCNGLIFEIGDINSLKTKLIDVLLHREMINELSKNAYESGKKYIYSFNKDIFIKYFLGENIK